MSENPINVLWNKVKDVFNLIFHYKKTCDKWKDEGKDIINSIEEEKKEHNRLVFNWITNMINGYDDFVLGEHEQSISYYMTSMYDSKKYLKKECFKVLEKFIFAYDNYYDCLNFEVLEMAYKGMRRQIKIIKVTDKKADKDKLKELFELFDKALNSMLEYGISIDKYYADKTYENLENYISMMEMTKEQNKED